MNKCIFVANLTKTPELKFIPSTGMAVCKFGVAINDGYGEKKTVSYINCTAFKATAEAIANYTDKGSKVAIESHVKTGSYQNKEGKTIYTTDFLVDKIEFIDKKLDGQAKPASNDFTDFDEDIFQPVENMDDVPF